MLPPLGKYRFEIYHSDVASALEDATLTDHSLMVERRTTEGFTEHTIAATLDREGRITSIAVNYSSHLFKRDANYRTDNEVFRGSVSTVAGRNEIVIKLGRFGEVEVAGVVAFRMLILAHVLERGQPRWTGRVAVIDPSSLTIASLKHTCRVGRTKNRWIYEARMGDTEEIEIDDAGRILASRSQDRTGSRLVSFQAAVDA